MKKFLSAAAGAVLLLCSFFLPATQSAKAAGSSLWPHVKLAAGAASTTADGSSTITITATFYIYECNNMYNGEYYTVDTPSDCDSHGGLRGEKLYTNYGQPCPYQDTITVGISVSGEATLSKTSVCGGAAGSDTFTIKSSVAGVKTLTPTTRWTYSGNTLVGSGVSVSFTAPAAAAPTPTKKSAAPTTPTPTPTAPAPPQAPTLSTLSVGGTEIKTDQPVSVAENKPLVLSGKTIPNGQVSLYVFSDPKQFTTTADKDGNWSVTVAGLPTGNHHAEIEVTDPATGQTSARAKLLQFSVVSAANKKPTTTASSAPSSSKTGLWIGIGLLIVLAGSAAGFVLWKHRRTPKQSATLPTNPTPANSDSSDDTNNSDSPN